MKNNNVVTDGISTCTGQHSAGGAGSHVEITFAGHFSAFCPLCAAIAKTAAVEETADKEREDMADACEIEKDAMERSRDNVMQQRDALAQSMADAIDTLRGWMAEKREAPALDKLADKLQRDAEAVGRMPE